MHRARLAGRVGPVHDHGHIVLRGYRHEFAKRGSDGTAKGTLLRDDGGLVHGVAYTLSAGQFRLLTEIENGYTVLHVELPEAMARTFVAKRPMFDLAPTTEYLGHYLTGMKEHDFPDKYVRLILAQAAT